MKCKLTLFFFILIIFTICLFLFIKKNTDTTLENIKSIITFSLGKGSLVNQADDIIADVQNNVDLLAQVALISFDTSVATKKYFESFINYTDPIVAHILKKTLWAHGVWIQINPKLTFNESKYYSWYLKEKNELVKQIPVERKLTPEEDPYYFKPIIEKRGVWSEVYEDPYIKQEMLTYSVPLYKNDLLIGVAGIDITLNEINNILIELQKKYHSSDIYFTDNLFNIIAAQPVNFSDTKINLIEKKTNLILLAEKIKHNNSGYFDYKDNDENKVVVYTKMSENFYLFAIIPVSSAYNHFHQLIYSLYGLFIVLASALCFAYYNKYKQSNTNKLLNEQLQKLRAAEKEIISAKENAEIANRAKSDFLANVSHEIRTPMNAILGFSEMLILDELTETQREYVELINTSGNNLLALINDILDLSKVESSEIELEKISFNIELLVNDIINLLKPKLADKDVELLCTIGDIHTQLIGDPTRLRQILINLLGNSVKFTENGEIEIYVSMENETETACELIIKIRDTGIGIPPSKLDSIFDPFKQVDSSTTRKYGGTGLGLAIVKRLVDKMNGKISIESEENKGTIFVLKLPFTKDLRSQLKNEKQISDNLSAVNIILVDDNQTSRLAIRRFIEPLSFKNIYDFSSAAETLEYLRNLSPEKYPEIGLLDIMMPEMDGYRLAQELLKITDNKIKLIALSSHIASNATERLKTSGFNAMLTKPVNRVTLIKTINSVLFHNKSDFNQMISKYSIQEIDYSNIKILVVEDNVINQKFMITLFKRMGYEIDVAENGEVCLNNLKTKKYDIIFMDIQMPVMDGITATHKIRELKIETPIIALTADAMKGSKEKYLNIGMNDYLTKPIKRNEITETLKKWIKRNSEQKISKKILIVDDSPTIKKIIEQTVKTTYPESIIKSANDGIAAVSMLAGFMPDLIIMDIMIPKMNGIELIKFMKNEPRYKKIGIFVITSVKAAEPVISEINSIGVQSLLFKPFNYEKLIDALKCYYEGRNLTDRIQIEDFDIVKKWLEYFKDDPEFSVVTLAFVKELPEYIKNLNNYFNENNISELKKLAHSIKGSSSSVGAAELAEKFTALDLELKKTDFDFVKIKNLINEINHIFSMIPEEYFDEK